MAQTASLSHKLLQNLAECSKEYHDVKFKIEQRTSSLSLVVSTECSGDVTWETVWVLTDTDF